MGVGGGTGKRGATWHMVVCRRLVFRERGRRGIAGARRRGKCRVECRARGAAAKRGHF
jgi:hypothetical protein